MERKIERKTEIEIMIYKNFSGMNIYKLPPLPLAEEAVEILAGNKNARVERIVSAGQVSGWYDQAETEFVALLDGSAVIEYGDGRSVKLSRGDTLIIKPHERHRVSFTSSEPPCVWLCVFYQ